MIVPKMLINTVANQLVKHFKLDKIMSYVFDDNELDVKVKKLEERVKFLEKLSDHLDLHLRIEKLEKKRRK
jgi:nicotinic acid mononucleotide adenylyltransferase